MAKKDRSFVVSTADAALFYDEVLVCTATANLNTSIEVSMQEQNINAGKGSKLLYSYKYGRELNVTLEAADWRAEYIAVNVGSKIAQQLSDVYKIHECVTLTAGIGVLNPAPVGDVAVELANGSIVTVTPDDASIDLTAYGLENESVYVTYRWNRITKSVVIDAETSPEVFKLVLDAEKHNNRLGKVGHIQVIVPSYQPSGNFTMDFTPDGTVSTNIDGRALAVEGDTCADGSGVYAYVHDFEDGNVALNVAEIAATPATINLNSAEPGNTATISVIGLNGELYSPIELDNADCDFVSETPATATVDEDGVVTAVATGGTKITVTYNGVSDEVNVVVS